MQPQTRKARAMDDLQATLLLTRPQPQSRAFVQECAAALGRSVPAVISPLIRVEPCGVMPGLARFSAVIVTSGNAVRTLGDALRGRQVFAVGEATATLARDLGADASVLGENVDQFVENAAQISGPVIFCRGVHSRGDLANRLRTMGKSVEEAVVYDQVACPLSPAANALLTGSMPVIAPVFSPRTAGLLAGVRITAPLTIIAISDVTAEAWTGPGTIRIADAPTATAMAQAVTESF